MSDLPSTAVSGNLADQAAQVADDAIKSTQRAANQTLDSLAGTVQDLRHQVAPALSRATGQASAMVHGGVDALRQQSQQLRDRALRASDTAVTYIKVEPVKSMLMAAAAGAALMALINLVSHSRQRG